MVNFLCIFYHNKKYDKKQSYNIKIKFTHYHVSLEVKETFLITKIKTRKV